MTHQKKLLTVFVSPDGVTFNLAVVYNSYNLNPAFTKAYSQPAMSAGTAEELANALVASIKALKNTKWTSAMLQFDAWTEIPQTVLAADLSKYTSV